jgi:hypothetical protein
MKSEGSTAVRRIGLERLNEVKVLREADEVKVIVPSDLKFWEVGILIDEALRRACLHPNQLK